MNNVEYKVEGDKLVITVDISQRSIAAALPSSSGKTVLVGSTGGAMPLPSAHARSLSLSLNVMAKR